MRMARSGRFSGDMRPRNATYPPFAVEGGGMQVKRETVVHGGDEVGIGQRLALIVGNRHQRQIAKTEIEPEQVGKILAPVQRGDGLVSERPHHREMKMVDMEVQYVELI